MLADDRAGTTLPEAPRFSAFAEQFVSRYAVTNNKRAEVISKRKILRVHLVPAFGELRLHQVGLAEIEKYKAEKGAEQKRPGALGPQLDRNDHAVRAPEPGCSPRCCQAPGREGLHPPHLDDVPGRGPQDCADTTRRPARPGPRHPTWPRGSFEIPCCKSRAVGPRAGADSRQGPAASRKLAAHRRHMGTCRSEIPGVFWLLLSGAEGDRTPDLRIANAALSQLSYGPWVQGPRRVAGTPRLSTLEMAIDQGIPVVMLRERSGFRRRNWAARNRQELERLGDKPWARSSASTWVRRTASSR